MPKQPTKNRPVGRPKGSTKIPAGARPRAIRLTDAEYEKVLALIVQMRTAPTNSPDRPEAHPKRRTKKVPAERTTGRDPLGKALGAEGIV